jgi:hypothetical protein
MEKPLLNEISLDAEELVEILLTNMEERTSEQRNKYFNFLL